MSRMWRVRVLIPGLLVLGAVLAVGMAGLPDFGHGAERVGDVLNRVALPERQTDNVVAATVFDYRGFDTLGEEFILFAAVTGVVMLLREQTVEPDRQPPRTPVVSEALRMVGMAALGPALVVCGWLVAFGYITPGGGFQGGVLLAGTALLLFLAAGYRSFAAVARDQVADLVEAVGAGAYVAIGLAALVSGLPFLRNLFGAGQSGSLLSGGSIALLNLATAVAVAGANVLLFSHFLGAHVVPLVQERRS